MRVVALAETLAGVHRAVGRFVIQSPTHGASTSAIILLEGNMIAANSDVIAELVCRAPQISLPNPFLPNRRGSLDGYAEYGVSTTDAALSANALT
jgi:hypothetical protein